MTGDDTAEGRSLSPEWDRWFDETFTDLVSSDEDLPRRVRRADRRLVAAAGATRTVGHRRPAQGHADTSTRRVGGVWLAWRLSRVTPTESVPAGLDMAVAVG